ncbi:MAG: DUF2802 domain-containing protein [Thermodesulfobacteriota bacterium]
MESSILLVVDILITAAIFYLLLGMQKRGGSSVRLDNKAIHDSELRLRKSIEANEVREKELSTKQERLKNIIDKLDGALSDIRTAPSHEVDSEGAYSAARNLLQTGEPIENVVKICNLTKGEADVLSSITAMAS